MQEYYANKKNKSKQMQVMQAVLAWQNATTESILFFTQCMRCNQMLALHELVTCVVLCASKWEPGFSSTACTTCTCQFTHPCKQ